MGRIAESLIYVGDMIGWPASAAWCLVVISWFWMIKR